MREGDVSLACMGAFVDALVDHGVENVCVSPGSRSTPIALALYRHPRIRVHVHLDERSSAFFALGLAKATGNPAAVACTSGTAAANLFPAVVEASLSRSPLVVLTADRPAELRGVGANQTIDQLELFGKYAKWFVDAEVPGGGPEGGYWHALGADAAVRSRGHPPGPVHVNLPFREPLVPSGAKVELGGFALARREVGVRPPLPRGSDVERLTAMVKGVERGAIVGGGLRHNAAAAVALGRVLGWPLIAEPASGLRVPGALTAGQFLLADQDFASAHVPDLAVQIGAAPISRAGLALVATAKTLVIVDPDRLIADPARHASWTIEVDPGPLAAAVAERVDERAPTAWLQEWQDADAIARRVVDELIDSWDEPFEGRVARDLAAVLSDGSTLVVGSSMPVRDLDAFMQPRNGLRVLANRGASGIDGFVSTVLGVAASDARTYALCGDLSLLHDAGSLLWSAKRGHDAVFVVPNNDGGVMFSFLGQRELPELEVLFTTPHGLDLAKLADAAGAGHVRIERAGDLVPAVGRAANADGVWIVEVPSDRRMNVARHTEVTAAVGAALSVR